MDDSLAQVGPVLLNSGTVLRDGKKCFIFQWSRLTGGSNSVTIKSLNALDSFGRFSILLGI